MSECSKCGSPMQEGQDWCLQCGTGKPQGFGGGPGWRTGVAILAATAMLVGGASVAAYAALNKTKPKPAVVAVVAKTSTTSTTPTTPSATPTPGVPTTVKPAPKIPLQTSTPKSSSSEPLFPPETKTTPTPTPPVKKTEESKKGSTEPSGSEGSETKAGEEAPSPILLDTNAASVYNPYGFPASLFGEPGLAIDNEASTAWTAQVQASAAPQMAEGLVLDLKSPQKLGSAKVKTTTTGATVEIYGTNSTSLPTTISSPEWARLVGLKVLKKKTTAFKLKTKGKSYRYILLWLAKAPPSSTSANPGGVSINELELFPPASS